MIILRFGFIILKWIFYLCRVLILDFSPLIFISLGTNSLLSDESARFDMSACKEWTSFQETTYGEDLECARLWLIYYAPYFASQILALFNSGFVHGALS